MNRIIKNKEDFIKIITNEIDNGIELDMILHDLTYKGWSFESNNLYKREEILIEISDNEELTNSYYELKKSLQKFEELVGETFIVKPRGEYSFYNTIIEQEV